MVVQVKYQVTERWSTLAIHLGHKVGLDPCVSALMTLVITLTLNIFFNVMYRSGN